MLMSVLQKLFCIQTNSKILHIIDQESGQFSLRGQITVSILGLRVYKVSVALLNSSLVAKDNM